MATRGAVHSTFTKASFDTEPLLSSMRPILFFSDFWILIST